MPDTISAKLSTSPGPDRRWTGRFAPSPTGGLHFGSLIAALGSFLDARLHQGRWLVRIEDIDPPREQPGAADAILRTLERFGLHWDGPVVYQSRQTRFYQEALATLQAKAQLYRCTCSRREIAQISGRSALGPTYPGTCRNRPVPEDAPAALRVRTDDVALTLRDRLQGDQTECLAPLVGDFVVRRADGLWAYHLASVVDDIEAGVTHIVRGYDLLLCSFPQMWIYQALDATVPVYAHLPIATHADGTKLSKQTFARPVDTLPAALCFWHALAFLQQNPPERLLNAPLDELWQWALTHWQTELCRGITARPIDQSWMGR